MRVDIWSDVVCPWCYVGKARFEKALSGFGHRDEVAVVFRSFELDPGKGSGGRETNLEMISKKFGMPMAQARQMEERVAGREIDIAAFGYTSFPLAVSRSRTSIPLPGRTGTSAPRHASMLPGYSEPFAPPCAKRRRRRAKWQDNGASPPPGHRR